MTPEIYPLSLHDALPISTKASAASASLRIRNSENAPTAAWITRVKAVSVLVAASARADCSGSEADSAVRSEEHTSELQSHSDLVCRLLLEKKKYINH